MTNDETQFKLALAQAWLQNGQEGLARDIITKLIKDGLGEE
jgi:hypothetical protein